MTGPIFLESFLRGRQQFLLCMTSRMTFDNARRRRMSWVNLIFHTCQFLTEHFHLFNYRHYQFSELTGSPAKYKMLAHASCHLAHCCVNAPENNPIETQTLIDKYISRPTSEIIWELTDWQLISVLNILYLWLNRLVSLYSSEILTNFFKRCFRHSVAVWKRIQTEIYIYFKLKRREGPQSQACFGFLSVIIRNGFLMLNISVRRRMKIYFLNLYSNLCKSVPFRMLVTRWSRDGISIYLSAEDAYWTVLNKTSSRLRIEARHWGRKNSIKNIR